MPSPDSAPAAAAASEAVTPSRSASRSAMLAPPSSRTARMPGCAAPRAVDDGEDDEFGGLGRIRYPGEFVRGQHRSGAGILGDDVQQRLHQSPSLGSRQRLQIEVTDPHDGRQPYSSPPRASADTRAAQRADAGISSGYISRLATPRRSFRAARIRSTTMVSASVRRGSSWTGCVTGRPDRGGQEGGDSRHSIRPGSRFERRQRSEPDRREVAAEVRAQPATQRFGKPMPRAGTPTQHIGYPRRRRVSAERVIALRAATQQIRGRGRHAVAPQADVTGSPSLRGEAGNRQPGVLDLIGRGQRIDRVWFLSVERPESVLVHVHSALRRQVRSSLAASSRWQASSTPSNGPGSPLA